MYQLLMGRNIHVVYDITLSKCIAGKKEAMCSVLDFSVFVLEILTLLAQSYGVSGIQCYSCSYTRSNDWKVDYECVTVPANITRGDPQPKCPAAESSCYVRTVYTEGYEQVNSALRGCGKSDMSCKDKTCCNEFGPYPTCWTVCDTDLCNDLDGEIKLAVKSDRSTTTQMASVKDRDAGVSGIQCYSCSYTTSSDWKVDYECVTVPANITRGDPQPKCPAAESSCYVRMVYTEGYVQVTSALRGCGKSDMRCKDKTCCNEFGPYPTCWTVCDTDLCNDLDGEIKLAVKSDRSTTTQMASVKDRDAGVRY